MANRRTRLVSNSRQASGRAPRSRSIPKEVAPVVVQGPDLLAENDPYNAVGSTLKPKTAPAKTNHGPVSTRDKPVKRATRSLPTHRGDDVEVRRAPNRCVRSTSRAGEPLLQTEPPAPLDFGDDH